MNNFFAQRLILAVGILSLLTGYLGYILLSDLSRQFFRQDIGPWKAFSIWLAIFGAGLVALWFLGRVLSGGGEGEQLYKPASKQ
jgi:hypothetical protein